MDTILLWSTREILEIFFGIQIVECSGFLKHATHLEKNHDGKNTVRVLPQIESRMQGCQIDGSKRNQILIFSTARNF